MRIVQCISAFSNSGTTRVVVDLCNSLVENHEVYIVSMFSLTRFSHALNRIDDRIKIFTLHKQGRYDFRVPFKLITTISRIKPDVVHLHGNNVVQMALPAMFMQRFCKWYFTFHSVARYETSNRIQRKLLYLWMRMKLFTPVANAEIVRQSIDLEYGVKSLLLPNGRKFSPDELDDAKVKDEMAHFKESGRDLLLVCVSNITHVKNHIVLCKAFSSLCKRFPHLKLLLIGKKLDKDIVEIIESLQNRNIHILGERENVMPYLHYADAFCLTSLTESGPMVLLESFYAGTIPICTPAGDIPYKIQNGVNGLISSDFSVESYVKILHLFLNMSDKERIEMSKKAHQAAEEYHIEKIAKKALNMYKL